VKAVKDMSQPELAAHVQATLRQKGVDVVLSGGAAVSIYSGNQYVSKDLDLVITGNPNRRRLREAMEQIGFHEVGRHFEHPETDFFVEFPPGPLSVGVEPVARIDELRLETGTLRVISPSDCVKDRLSAYYHWGDRQCLQQAIMVAKSHDVDLREIEKWSRAEGKHAEFDAIKEKLVHSHS
jgi:hypothetical protein